MKTLFLPSIVLFTTSLWAGPTIAPTGWDLYLNMGANNNDGTNSDYVTVGGMSGGRFEGRLGTSNLAGQNRNLNLWCVDAQLYFNSNTTYRANSLGFEQIDGENTTGNNWTNGGGGSRDVRYEDVPGFTNNGAYNPTTGANDNFRIALGVTLANGVTDGAKFRYRMAAWLLDQYELKSSNLGDTAELVGASIGQGKYDPRNSTRNQAILKAIWSAMDTEGDAPDQTLSGNSATWFNKAATYVNTNWQNGSLWSKWNIVSGWSGTSYVRNYGGPVQTFLTETPEPGFYGLLCSGLGALVWMANRRKKNADAVA